MSSDSDAEDTWEEVESEEEESTFVCLFCTHISKSMEDLISHCRKEHDFDLPYIYKSHNLDSITFIKMVNYIRKETINISVINSLQSGDNLPWDDDKYMEPAMKEDNVLMYDMDDYIERSPINPTDLKQDENEMLKEEIRKLTLEQRKVQTVLKETVEALNYVRSSAAKKLLSAADQLDVDGDQRVKQLRPDEDDGYFGSYAHFGIHQEMLNDRVRTESYRDSVYQNREFFEGKVVLDVGCGTGILSMFAARAGASKVFAVDMSDICFQATDIIRENKLDHIITVLKGRVEDVDIPVEKVDIIISEWMGYFLLFESMLDSVLYARDHLLSPGGVMLPNAGSIILLGIEDLELSGYHLDRWQDMYGFSMSCMRTCVLKEALVEVIDSNTICTDTATVKDLDLQTCTIKDLDFVSEFSLTATKDCQLTAIVGYFDIFFNKFVNKVSFSTSPRSKSTHWKQTVFLLSEPLKLKEGETVQCKLNCRKDIAYARSLKVSITINSKKQTFMLQ